MRCGIATMRDFLPLLTIFVCTLSSVSTSTNLFNPFPKFEFLVQFSFLIPWARCLIGPHLSPLEACICTVKQDNGVNSISLLVVCSAVENVPGGIRITTWQTIHINCSDTEVVFFFLFSSPPQYAVLLSWQQLQLWHGDCNALRKESELSLTEF